MNTKKFKKYALIYINAADSLKLDKTSRKEYLQFIILIIKNNIDGELEEKEIKIYKQLRDIYSQYLDKKLLSKIIKLIEMDKDDENILSVKLSLGSKNTENDVKDKDEKSFSEKKKNKRLKKYKKIVNKILSW